MGLNLCWSILCQLEAHFILYFAKGKSFWMLQTTTFRLGLHKGKCEVFLFLMAFSQLSLNTSFMKALSRKSFE